MSVFRSRIDSLMVAVLLASLSLAAVATLRRGSATGSRPSAAIVGPLLASRAGPRPGPTSVDPAPILAVAASLAALRFVRRRP